MADCDACPGCGASAQSFSQVIIFSAIKLIFLGI